MCCCSGGAASTEAFVTKHAHCILGAAFLASVLFVTAKYCQTKCATSLFSGCSRFALSKPLRSLRGKKLKSKSTKTRYEAIHPERKLKDSNPSTLIAKSALFPLHYTEFGKTSDSAIYGATRASRASGGFGRLSPRAPGPRRLGQLCLGPCFLTV